MRSEFEPADPDDPTREGGAGSEQTTQLLPFQVPPGSTGILKKGQPVRAAKNGGPRGASGGYSARGQAASASGARRRHMTDVVIDQEQKQEVAAPEWAVHVRKNARSRRSVRSS